MLVLIGIVAVMLALSPTLALFTFSIVPLLLLATYLFSKRAKVAFRQTRRSVAGVVGTLAEHLTGMRVVQAYAQEKAMRGPFCRGEPGQPRRLCQRDETLVCIPSHG